MLGTTYETAWFLNHRLREAGNDIGGSGPLGGENKVIEADESYIGGKARNKAYGPPPKKMAVFTLVERGGRARSRHVADVTQRHCAKFLSRKRAASPIFFPPQHCEPFG
jgi:hypothetical protein